MSIPTHVAARLIAIMEEAHDHYCVDTLEDGRTATNKNEALLLVSYPVFAILEPYRDNSQAQIDAICEDIAMWVIQLGKAIKSSPRRGQTETPTQASQV